MRETSSECPAELALVLHFHQPAGNFDHVFEKVTAQCYAPLLGMLAEFEGLRTHLHFNGILLDWFDRHRPDLIAQIGDLVRDGRVELLTGGHQEPILSVLPEADAVGQIRALTEELHQRFGTVPQGAWLTERVYEPRLPTPLARAGVRYVTLDDQIFHWAGLEAGSLLGHFMTDDAGHPLALFPAARSLRYTIPFRPHQETFDLLHAAPVRDGVAPLMVYADDAEKFGEWPGTFEWVYEKGWLREFFGRLTSDVRVRTVHLSERLDRCAALGRVYPPTASYPEMTVWALPTPARARMESRIHRLEEEDPTDLLEDLRGGHWRGFLAKYPEVHRLHKRMLRVSRRLESLRGRGFEEAPLARITRDLYAGQCNDAYWHGAFGGVYLPHLRRAVEHHLILAERGMDTLEHGPLGFERARSHDFHADGAGVLELTTGLNQVLVDPAGCAILSWDLRPAAENWVTVMQRHEEPFHADLREGRIVRVDEHGLPLEQGDGESGVATIHGAVRVKPGVEVADLQVDRHSRVAGLLWSGPPDCRPADPREAGTGTEALAGPWEVAALTDTASCHMQTEQAGLRVARRILLNGVDGSLEDHLEVEPTAGPRTLFSEWNLCVGWTGDDLVCEGGSAPAGERTLGDAPLRFSGAATGA